MKWTGKYNGFNTGENRFSTIAYFETHSALHFIRLSYYLIEEHRLLISRNFKNQQVTH
jgi:hypothetical protein